MSELKTGGSCLCGAISYHLSGPYRFFKYCHCSRCRKATGSAFAANILVPADQFSWQSGEDLLRHFELAAASGFSTGFCDRCGSRMPWVTRDGRWVLVPAGTLDEDPDARPEKNIFWDSRAPWYEGTEALPAFPEGA
jgi:hypothetical protein